MISQDDDVLIHSLMDFGPTLLQSRIYLALVNLETADVKTISKASEVARSDVYRTMPALEKMGLAQKIISETTMYKATPMKKGLLILLQNRKEECLTLEKKFISLITNNCHDRNRFEEEKQEFKITSESTILRRMIIDMIRKATTSIDMIIVPGNVLQWMLYNDSSYFSRINKGIKVRVLTKKIEKKPPIKPQLIASSQNIEIKYLNLDHDFGMHIIDKKEVTIGLTSQKGCLPSLWSNNHNIAEIAEAYFENLWRKARRI